MSLFTNGSHRPDQHFAEAVEKLLQNMGVKDLSKRLRDDRKATNNLEELRVIVCGEDLSVI